MSIVTNQFPQIVFREGDKCLWNPVQKKALKNRPEERVRLRVIEYLLAAGWSKHRISTEEGISSSSQKLSGFGGQAGKGKLRTDLICYTRDFNPFLLVECKAPSVPISDQTAEQIARYNRKVYAPWLLMTNGKTDLWYAFENKSTPILQDQLPGSFKIAHQPEERTFEYWMKCGFAGKKASPGLRKWLRGTLNESFDSSKLACRYISFKRRLFDIDINHYYHIFSFSNIRIALTIVATAFGDTRLVAIENKNGKNTSVLEVNLDLLFDSQKPNASIYSSDGSKNVNIKEELEWNETTFSVDTFSEKVKHLLAS